MKVHMTPEEASAYLGISPARIREMMRDKRLDLGLAIPPSPDKSSWEYHIYRGKLKKIIGEDLDDEGGVTVSAGS